MDSFFCFIDKPRGMTSQQALSRFKRQYNYKKVGHHGTLDPFATGLLLVGVNEATKFFQFIDDSSKTYRATIRLGEKTDTLDCEGEVVESGVVPVLSLSEIVERVNLQGEIEQTPPMYSAVKVKGKKLYELARAGKEVERPSRKVTVHDLKILNWQSPLLEFEATVSRGTYIRVLAEQLAEQLGTWAHCVELCRTCLCGRELADGFSLDEKEIPAASRLSIETLLKQYQSVELNPEQVKQLFYGQALNLDQQSSQPLLAFEQQRFLGVIAPKGVHWKSLRLIDPHK